MNKCDNGVVNWWDKYFRSVAISELNLVYGVIISELNIV